MSKENSNEYYEDMLKTLNRQIREAEEQTGYLSAESSYDYQEEKPSISKKSKLESLKKKYTYVKTPFNKYRDRDQYKQYWLLVSTKNLIVAEFVLKWEHEHKKRIHKNMAWELLTELKDKGSVSDEFLKRINQKYEE